MINNRHSLSARARLGILVVTIALGTLGPSLTATRHDSDNPSSAARETQGRLALNAYGKLPASFVENRGQMDARVRYYARGDRYGFYLTRDEVVLSLAKEHAGLDVALALRFVHANPQMTLEGAERAPGEINYLRGSDPADWQTGLSQYKEVVYRNLWRGIDLRVHEASGVLKYEFHVQPGARVEDIRLDYAGAAGLTVDASGALLIDTAAGVLCDSAPVSYQDVDGAHVPVKSRYVVGRGSKGRVAFAVDESYRTDRELIIDPGVQYTTFLGGSDVEDGAGIVVDAAGNAYVTGATQSANFPTTVGAFRRTGAVNAFTDVFITKLNATGTALVYSTFVGGSDLDFGRRIAIDASGNAYVTGQTKSSNFPTTGGAFRRTLNIPANCPRCVTDNTDT